MYTIEIKKKSSPKAVSLTELLEWKTKMLQTEKEFLLNATLATSSTMKEYNQQNADIVSHQLAFLERLINQAIANGEKK